MTHAPIARQRSQGVLVVIGAADRRSRACYDELSSVSRAMLWR
jgi:hypothetical protein